MKPSLDQGFTGIDAACNSVPFEFASCRQRDESGFWGFFFVRNLRQASLIPVGDPRLGQSLSYDNGVPK